MACIHLQSSPRCFSAGRGMLAHIFNLVFALKPLLPGLPFEPNAVWPISTDRPRQRPKCSACVYTHDAKNIRENSRHLTRARRGQVYEQSRFTTSEHVVSSGDVSSKSIIWRVNDCEISQRDVDSNEST